MKKLILIITLITVVIATGFIAKQSFAQKILIRSIAYFAPKQEVYTELYFENNEHLPIKQSTITDFQHVAYTFSFTIHNKEGKDMMYPYEVTMNGVTKEILDIKTVLVKNNATKKITETFYLPNSVPSRREILVELSQKNQQIDFWMGGNQ